MIPNNERDIGEKNSLQSPRILLSCRAPLKSKHATRRSPYSLLILVDICAPKASCSDSTEIVRSSATTLYFQFLAHFQISVMSPCRLSTSLFASSISHFVVAIWFAPLAFFAVCLSGLRYFVAPLPRQNVKVN